VVRSPADENTATAKREKGKKAECPPGVPPPPPPPPPQPPPQKKKKKENPPTPPPPPQNAGEGKRKGKRERKELLSALLGCAQSEPEEKKRPYLLRDC